MGPERLAALARETGRRLDFAVDGCSQRFDVTCIEQCVRQATLEVAVTSSPGVFQDVLVHLYPSGGSELRDFPWELVSPVKLKPASPNLSIPCRTTVARCWSPAMWNPKHRRISRSARARPD